MKVHVVVPPDDAANDVGYEVRGAEDPSARFKLTATWPDGENPVPVIVTLFPAWTDVGAVTFGLTTGGAGFAVWVDVIPAGLVPTLFRATTLTVYAVSAVNPVIVQEMPVVAHDRPLGVAVAV